MQYNIPEGRCYVGTLYVLPPSHLGKYTAYFDIWS